MSIPVVALLAAVLSGPALLGLAGGSVDPDTAGLRVLLAVACAMVMEAVGRRFLDAVRPVEQPADQAADVDGAAASGDAQDGGAALRRRTDR